MITISAGLELLHPVRNLHPEIPLIEASDGVQTGVAVRQSARLIRREEAGFRQSDGLNLRVLCELLPFKGSARDDK